MKSEQIILESDIVTAIVTALESNNGHWYWLPKIDNVTRTEGNTLAKDIVLSALAGSEIPLHSKELESSVIGFLCKSNIQQGIQSYMDDGREFKASMNDVEADALLQFIVLGENSFN